MNISALLRMAGVSRNAFYTLARRDSLLPSSLTAVAESLGVPASALLDPASTGGDRLSRLMKEIDRISKQHRSVEPDNVRHTLLLLDERPVERLRRALRRGRQLNFR